MTTHDKTRSVQPQSRWLPSLRSEIDPLRQLTVTVTKWHGAQAEQVADEVAMEEPLEVRTPGSSVLAPDAPDAADEATETLAVIMRTPGNDDELACGFLYSEGLVHSAAEIAGVRAGRDGDGLPSPNIIEVLPGAGIQLAARAQEEGYSRKFAVNSSCGICGKNTVDAACTTFPTVPMEAARLAPEVLYALPDRLRAEQRVFRSTGGLHAAGLFTYDGTLVALREDIGRHNAVDKLIGRALLDDQLPLRERVLLVSGRLSFEIVLKALAAGIGIVAAVSAPSSLALDLAQSGGVTLAGFLRGPSVNIYTHPQRIQGTPEAVAMDARQV